MERWVPNDRTKAKSNIRVEGSSKGSLSSMHAFFLSPSTFFFFLRATPVAYGGSQARGRIEL